jgi:biotin transport system substrate-specific component
LVVSTDRSRARDATLVVAGAAWIAGLGQLAIPLGFTPVPMTMGTFAVLTAGAALGVQRAAAATLLFLVSGLAGAPVFAGGQSGAGLPTLGYAIGYIGAATLVGWAAERGLDRSPGRAFGVMAVGSAVVYLVGVPYLTVAAGLTLDGGIVQGLVPFLVGDLIKAVAGAAALTGAWLATGGRAAARRS